jgi:ubiquinone/menaquinone biosynthesis C-methylase UbiE
MTVPRPDTGTEDPFPSALQRARPLLRRPGFPEQGFDPPVSAEGFVETLPGPASRTLSQRALDTAFTAWAYDRLRDPLLRLAGMADFPTEVETIARRLRPGRGDVVLDLACGQGNFTIEWANLVGPEGLVIGLDYSRSMLRRAVARVRESGLSNVLLLHGDAHRLPLASSSMQRINCSGGFHAFPDLPTALSEIRRVSAPGTTLTASTFAEAPADRWAMPKRRMKRWFGLHFVPLAWLGEQLETLGFREFDWRLYGGGFAYTSAIRGA